MKRLHSLFGDSSGTLTTQDILRKMHSFEFCFPSSFDNAMPTLCKSCGVHYREYRFPGRCFLIFLMTRVFSSSLEVTLSQELGPLGWVFYASSEWGLQPSPAYQNNLFHLQKAEICGARNPLEKRLSYLDDKDLGPGIDISQKDMDRTLI